MVAYGPCLAAAAVLLLSLLAKFYMSFAIRSKEGGAYELVDKEKRDQISRAQLNVAEYEALFMVIFFFWDLQGTESLLVTIVCYVAPIAQAVFFWGRTLTGNVMPWSPLGALPRYICMGISIYVLWTVVTADGVKYGSGLAGVAVLFLSLAAKLMMSFGYRVSNKDPGDAGKAQLNVAEYEALFMAILFFFYQTKTDNILVTIVSYVVPIAQAIYFWGRALSGKAMPWAPLGALPRYICMGISIYILWTVVTKDGVKYGPGLAGVAVLFLSLAAKLMMSFGYRAADKDPGDAGKAQLNVAEYEALFLSIFLYLDAQKTESLLVTILSYVVPIAQAVYFWGRALSGKMMPWAPLGALPRYISMGIFVYVLYTLSA